MGSKRRSFRTVSHKDLLTINASKSMFSEFKMGQTKHKHNQTKHKLLMRRDFLRFLFKMGQTKHKPLRTRDFLRFFPRNCGLHLEYIFLKNKYKE